MHTLQKVYMYACWDMYVYSSMERKRVWVTDWEEGGGREWRQRMEENEKKIKMCNRLSTIYFSIVPNHNFAQQKFQWQKWTNQYV